MSDGVQRAQPYHHGNLRAVLIAAGRAILEEGGGRALSLREVARRAGVSHAAPAHHFSSIGSFLAACATAGFTDFAHALGQSRTSRADVAAAIAQMGRAYLAFAHQNPVVFRLMFDRGRYDDRTPEQQAIALQSYDHLVDATRALDPTVSAIELDYRVSAIWSLTHGYADLMLEGHFCPDGVDPADTLARTQDQIERALLALVRGLRASLG